MAGCLGDSPRYVEAGVSMHIHLQLLATQPMVGNEEEGVLGQGRRENSKES